MATETPRNRHLLLCSLYKKCLVEGSPEKVQSVKEELLADSARSITPEELDPECFGIARADFDALAGGDAETNAVLVRDVVTGKNSSARKDIVVLNAAAAIMVAGLAKDFVQGIEKADASIHDGSAAACLEKLIEISNG